MTDTHPVRVGLLGPIVVEIDGVERPITARRQRAVLARLALEPGEAISPDRLLDDVWGEDRPSTGRKSVAYQISMLRSTLEPRHAGEGTVIATSAAGYTLLVRPDDVDIHRFERLVDDARSALASDPTRCIELVDEARALWRGRAFADLGDEPFVEPEVRRLEERRSVARMTAAEALISRGRATEVIADLIEMVDDRPFDEALVGLLMVALDRAGRTGDALRAYGDLRLRLGGELGIEPAPWLQALEAEIMNEGHAFGPLVVGSQLSARPHPVPAALSPFVGRRDEMAAITSALASSRLVTLCGFGGLGKTRLAQEIARQMSDRCAHGVWYVDLVSISDERALPEAVARAGGLVLRPGPDPVDQLLACLRHRELLVVLDNCEHLVDAVARLVSTILPAAPGGRVLATSRVSLGAAGEVIWTVPPLDPVSAAELFADRARLSRPESPDGIDAAHLGRLVGRLDGVPLAIELAAARLAMMGLAQVDARLHDVLRTPGHPGRDDDPRQRSLDAVLGWSYQLLDESDRTLLRRLSTCVGGFDLDAATQIGSPDPANVGVVDVLDRLGHLVETGLIEFDDHHGPPRYRMLEVVRRFASDRLDPGERDDAARGHAAHYRSVAATIEALCDSDFHAAVLLGEREIGNLRAAMRWALDGGDPVCGLSIALDTRSFFYTHLLPRESLRWVLAGLARTEGDDEQRLLAAAHAVKQACNVMDVEARGAAAAQVARGLATTRDPRVRAELLDAMAAHVGETAPRASDALTVEAIELDASPPHRTLAFLANRVFASWEIGSIDDADGLLRRLDDLSPDFSRSHPGFAVVETGVAARAGRWEEVIRLADADPDLDPGSAAQIGLVRAEALGALGRHDTAIEVLASIGPGLTGHDRWWTELVHASIDLRRGAPDVAARRLSVLAAEIARQTGPLAIGMQVAALLGVAAHDLGEAETAATLLGHSAAERRRLDIGLRASDRPLVDRATEACRAELGDDRFDELTECGAATALGELPGVDPEASRRAG